MARLKGSYCPLCGELDLQIKKMGGKTYAYCPQGEGVTGPKDAHTAYVIDDGGAPEPQSEPEPEKKSGSEKESEVSE